MEAFSRMLPIRTSGWRTRPFTCLACAFVSAIGVHGLGLCDGYCCVVYAYARDDLRVMSGMWETWHFILRHLGRRLSTARLSEVKR